MKKRLLVALAAFLTLFYTSAVNSQTMGNLWGALPYAGDSIGGSIIKYSSVSGNNSVVHSFSRDGIAPLHENLLKANDGNLYGTTSYGGIKNNGTIFRYNPTTNQYKSICYFEDTLIGKLPKAGLIQASNDTLYGMTSSGGAFGKGTIYKSDLNGNTAVLYSLNTTNNDGYNPYGKLIEYNNALYGLTKDGGAYGKGTLFKISFSGVFTKLHDFGNGSDGANPWASVVYHNNALYGTTELGGTNNLGTIFKYDLNTMQESVLVSFIVATGSNPKGSLIVVNDTLYGTTSLRGPGTNGGSIIKCSFTGNLSVVDHFVGAYANPECGLALINDTLYGTTPFNYGSVFKCPLIGTISNIHFFNDTAGNAPRCTLLPVNDTLYGFTGGGGATTEGTLFSITTSGSFSLLHEFGTNSMGYSPFNTLLQASDGNMYGMNSAGGDFGFGTIFKVTPTGTISTIYHFKNLADGRPSQGGLIEINDTLYGITTMGGDYDMGTIFKCSFSGQHQVMHSFGSLGNDGMYPMSSLFAMNDTIYGTTYVGGDNGDGTIYRITLSGNFSILNHFGGLPGMPRYSTGSFIAVSDTLYGLTQYGGANDMGCIYKCSIDGNIQVLYSFGTNANDGMNPFVDLILASDSNLYGTTSAGGSNNFGTIFKCSINGAASTVYSFTSNDGKYPSGSLLQASDSLLYGVTPNGGINDKGVLFKCSLNGNYSNVVQFDETTGYCGQPSSSLIEYMTVSISKIASCTGDTLVANVNGGGVGYVYLWNTGATTQKIKINQSGNYTITILNTKGAIAQASVNASYASPLSVNVSSNDSICYGDTTQISATANGGHGNYTYAWAPGNLAGNTQNVNPDSTTVYIVSVSDSLGCVASDSLIIKVNPAISISLSNPDTICLGASTTITVTATGGTGAFNYTWSLGSLLANTFTVSPTNTTAYIATASDLWGCTKQDSVLITVEICTGIANQINETVFVVYPNPSSGEFNVVLNNLNTTNSKLIVENVLGEVVYVSTLSSLNTSIDLKHLTNGTYFISMLSADFKSTRKIFINR
ncbi:MAG: T9SS type A sorting domain-containing protein [Bacteroidetes bacterium]|nr:T9SS type A sorting domain-containing protein [Bacteroidota bacterium]